MRDYFAGSAADGDGAGVVTGAGPGSATGTRCCVSETLQPPEQLEQDETPTEPHPEWQC